MKGRRQNDCENVVQLVPIDQMVSSAVYFGFIEEGEAVSAAVRVGLEALQLRRIGDTIDVSTLLDSVPAAFEKFRTPADRMAIGMVGLHIAAKIGGYECVENLTRRLMKIA